MTPVSVIFVTTRVSSPCALSLKPVMTMPVSSSTTVVLSLSETISLPTYSEPKPAVSEVIAINLKFVDFKAKSSDVKVMLNVPARSAFWLVQLRRNVPDTSPRLE